MRAVKKILPRSSSTSPARYSRARCVSVCGSNAPATGQARQCLSRSRTGNISGSIAIPFSLYLRLFLLRFLPVSQYASYNKASSLPSRWTRKDAEETGPRGAPAIRLNDTFLRNQRKLSYLSLLSHLPSPSSSPFLPFFGFPSPSLNFRFPVPFKCRRDRSYRNGDRIALGTASVLDIYCRCGASER